MLPSSYVVEGAGVSYVTLQGHASFNTKTKYTLCSSIKLQAIHWIKLFSSICLDYKFVFVKQEDTSRRLRGMNWFK